MALEDKDIFSAICSRCPDQPIEVVMAQYEKAKRLNMDIEQRLVAPVACEQQAPVEEPVPVIEVVEEEQPPKKKYTRRSLKVKPADAITDTAILCCICGEERQSLTSTHLKSHGITPAEYKALCGYDPKQPLMSRQHLVKSQGIIAQAQQKRMEKRENMSAQ